jgi:peptidyl-prolyl cis-trans isomerase SurA
MERQTLKGISGFRTRLILISALGATMAAPLAAQSVADEPLSVVTQSLDLPPNFTVFGKRDPNLHKATAIVNGQIITQTDIEQRVALILATNNAQKISEEDRERLRLQTFRDLIDETLKIQEAAAQEIVVDKAEVEQAMEDVAGRFQRSLPQFDAFVTQQGSSPASIRHQIRGELAWGRLQQKIFPFVNVSEEEVQGTLKRMMAAKGSEEIRVGEIWMRATPATALQVQTNLRDLAEQIIKGASFATFARTYSQTSTASVGGDLGWLRPAQLPPELEKVAGGMEVNQLVGPIAVADGFSIVMMIDKRKVLTTDPRDAVLSLKQIEIKFPPGTTPAQANARIETFDARTREIKGCGNANEVAKQLGADIVDRDDVIVRRDLPAELQTIVLGLQVGQATVPFGALTDGVRVFVLCGREEPTAANAPSADDIRNQMEEIQRNKRAQIKLRDLRRDAVIDYN